MKTYETSIKLEELSVGRFYLIERAKYRIMQELGGLPSKQGIEQLKEWFGNEAVEKAGIIESDVMLKYSFRIENGRMYISGKIIDYQRVKK